MTRGRKRYISRAAGLLLVGGSLLASAAPAPAGPSPQRTVLVHAGSRGNPDGPSTAPDISADGRLVAFASVASNLAGKPAVKTLNVFLYNQENGAVSLITAGAAGKGGDGPSTAPAIAADGSAIAFVSGAHNLLSGSIAPARKEVYVWSARGGTVRASIGLDGKQANGDCGEPDISGDGRIVVFSCAATNLAPGAAPGRRNVYARDLAADRTTLVSAGPKGAPADGDSVAPAISPDGRFATFATAAKNVIPGATPATKPQILLRDLASGGTPVVSVANSGAFQNAAVKPPFSQLSDVSSGGRFVVFDSDAANLVAGDTNHHTDVFLRDLSTRKTTRASLAVTDQQGNSDSFAPRITADGRYVTFESFATNLTPLSPFGGNVFVRDLSRHTTVMANVSSRGRPRGPEHVKQLLQRPAIADDGATVAFESSARDLVSGVHTRFDSVFLRRLLPAPITVASQAVTEVAGHIVIRFSSSDRQAGSLLCQLDHRPPAICPLGGAVLPRLKGGRHVLRAYAGGQGTAFASLPIVIRIDARHHLPKVKVINPANQLGLG
ncbi:MAG: hypothetical protein NVSMB51_00930 [Solirubrobacteraceae bacterium]